ncbi:MAG: hypothetical protein WAN65_01010 [Candidatus Sulfotelmatobacter sp.]
MIGSQYNYRRLDYFFPRSQQEVGFAALPWGKRGEPLRIAQRNLFFLLLAELTILFAAVIA